jgi:hypothetical protein
MMGEEACSVAPATVKSLHSLGAIFQWTSLSSMEALICGNPWTFNSNFRLFFVTAYHIEHR